MKQFTKSNQTTAFTRMQSKKLKVSAALNKF